MLAGFTITGERRTGEVVKRNAKTVWVRTTGKHRIVKRHCVKHHVVLA